MASGPPAAAAAPEATSAPHAAYAAEADSHAALAADEDGFVPMARMAEVLEFAVPLADAEDAVCAGGTGAKARLAAVLEELRVVQAERRDAMRAKPEVVELCQAAIEDGKQSTLLYDVSFGIIAKSSTAAMDRYHAAAAKLDSKVLQEAGHVQPLTELADLYEEAVRVRPAARTVMEGIERSTKAKLQPMGPLKRVSRASEKVVLRPEGTGGAENVCDIVRDMFECQSVDEMADVIELICNEPTIEVVRFKNRIDQPSNGWRDAMINYRVKGTTHVCELQVAHADMVMQRKRMGGHAAYATGRNATELLEFMGKL